jgi:hypothetical protein
MHAASDSRVWARLAVATVLALASPATGQRFHARFDPIPEGPVLIFGDDFESGGNCRWASTEACTLYILTIPPDTGGGDHSFPTVIFLQVGTVLHIFNGDISPHRIHANNTIGLLHQVAEMGQGEEYVGTITNAGEDTLYCHTDGTGSGTMLVQVP